MMCCYQVDCVLEWTLDKTDRLPHEKNCSLHTGLYIKLVTELYRFNPIYFISDAILSNVEYLLNALFPFKKNCQKHC